MSEQDKVLKDGDLDLPLQRLISNHSSPWVLFWQENITLADLFGTWITYYIRSYFLEEVSDSESRTSYWQFSLEKFIFSLLTAHQPLSLLFSCSVVLRTSTGRSEPVCWLLSQECPEWSSLSTQILGQRGEIFKNANWSTVPNSVELLVGARDITVLWAFKNHPELFIRLRF